MTVIWYACVCAHAGVCVCCAFVHRRHTFVHGCVEAGVGVGCLHLLFFALFSETVSLIKLGLTDWLDWSAC